VKERDLPSDIALGKPMDLTFSNHVHRLVFRGRIQGAAGYGRHIPEILIHARPVAIRLTPEWDVDA
jgi:hypothetical protein